MQVSEGKRDQACPDEYSQSVQNGVAERWVGSIRREMLDHVIPLNDQHLMRPSLEYVRSYQDDGTHLGLHKQTPGSIDRNAT